MIPPGARYRTCAVERPLSNLIASRATLAQDGTRWERRRTEPLHAAGFCVSMRLAPGAVRQIVDDG